MIYGMPSIQQHYVRDEQYHAKSNSFRQQHAKSNSFRQQHPQILSENEQSLFKIIKLALQPELKQIRVSLLRLEQRYQYIKSRQDETVEKISVLSKNYQNMASSLNILVDQSQTATKSFDLAVTKLAPNRKIKIFKKKDQFYDQNQQQQKRYSTPEFNLSHRPHQLEQPVVIDQLRTRVRSMQPKNPKQIKVKKQIVKPQIDPKLQPIIKASLILNSLNKASSVTKNLAQTLQQRGRDIINKYKLQKIYEFPLPVATQYNHKFHQFIDGKPNILLLVQVKNLQTILAAFTSIPFIKRNIPQPNQQAFIANLSKNRIYKPKNYCKTICFDENFLLFGNSQIRIKVKQEKVYTNFGISKGFFQNGNDGLAQFMEQDIQQQWAKSNRLNRFEQKIQQDKDGKKKSRREFQIIRYQIFQLIQKDGK